MGPKRNKFCAQILSMKRIILPDALIGLYLSICFPSTPDKTGTDLKKLSTTSEYVSLLEKISWGSRPWKVKFLRLFQD